MYILRNAFRCISRAKARSILIGAVALLLSVSSCIGLSIKQANKTVKKQYAEDMEISATLNPKNMRESGNISLDTLKELSSDENVKRFYYSSSLYFAAGDGIEPLDVAGSFGKNKDFKEKYGDIKNGQETTTSTESVEGTSNNSNNDYSVVTLANTSSEESNTSENNSSSKPTEEKKEENLESNPSEQYDDKKGTSGEDSSDFPTPPSDDSQSGQPQMPGGGGDTFITNKFFFNMASQNDFTVMGYSDESAIPEYISSLGVLDADSEELNCVISQNLADENEIEVGATFTLKNPDNEDESYTFTVVGICDTSKSSESSDSSSNASFTDNYIYVSSAAIDKIIASSAELNPETTETDDDGNEKTVNNALTATYSGTFIFKNLDCYNAFSDTVSDDYSLVSEDVSNYETSISQLETLGKYATYFLIVIFIIGAFVLVIINLSSIRNRKYEIGVLTAIGMKKQKVALQFVTELFVITFAALIIGSGIGAAVSVPVTNSLLTTINSTETTENESTTSESASAPQAPDNKSSDSSGNSSSSSSGNSMTPPSMPNGGNGGDSFNPFSGGGTAGQKFDFMGQKMNNYIASVSSATDLTVILQMILVGLGLTLISSAAAILIVMRYEPLKILSNRD